MKYLGQKIIIIIRWRSDSVVFPIRLPDVCRRPSVLVLCLFIVFTRPRVSQTAHALNQMYIRGSVLDRTRFILSDISPIPSLNFTAVKSPKFGFDYRPPPPSHLCVVHVSNSNRINVSTNNIKQISRSTLG